MRLPQPPLLVVTDRKQAQAVLEDVLAAAFDGGCRWASIREKDLPAEEQNALASRLLPIAHRFGATLTLHGEAQVAQAAGLHGVHLSAGSDASAARALLGDETLIGISIHGVAEAAELDPLIVDYAIAGPVFETASKPGYGPALGPASFARVAASTGLPVIAIGGLDAGNAMTVLDAGAHGLAVMGGIMRAKDPAEEVTTLLQVLRQKS